MNNCECCKTSVKAEEIICAACVADYYRVHSLWMAGLNQTKEKINDSTQTS